MAAVHRVAVLPAVALPEVAVRVRTTSTSTSRGLQHLS